MSKNPPTRHVLLAEFMAMAQKCGDSEVARVYHASLKDDRATWANLEFRGYQDTGEEETQLELRNCARCGSTLAVKVQRS